MLVTLLDITDYKTKLLLIQLMSLKKSYDQYQLYIKANVAGETSIKRAISSFSETIGSKQWRELHRSESARYTAI